MIFALNFLTIDPDKPLSGIGNYCVKLLDNMRLLANERQLDVEFDPYIQAGAEHHFPNRLRSILIPLPRVVDRWRRVIFEQTRLAYLLRNRRTDLLLNPALTGPIWGVRRTATVVHDLYFRTVPELLDPWQRRYLRVMVPLNCWRSWRVFTDSVNGAHDLLKFYPAWGDRVAAVPLAGRFDPAPPAFPRPGIVPDRSYVLMVANLTGNKNPEAAVAAVAEIRAAGRDVEFVHVGLDPGKLLERAIAHYGAESWVTRLHGIDDDSLVAVFQHAECLVVPSIYEGFGLPVLEGQQLGVPVISANASCLPEVGGDGALYFDPFDHSALARQVLRLQDQPGLRADLIARGARNAASYSWQRTAVETMRHLNLIPA